MYGQFLREIPRDIDSDKSDQKSETEASGMFRKGRSAENNLHQINNWSVSKI